MPRRLLKKFAPKPHALREMWFARLFGARLADPRLWSFHRRGVTAAFGAGLAICFIPLPVHTLVAIFTAVVRRISIPVIIATTWVVNPFTVFPIYYGAYRLGTFLTRTPPRHFRFSFSWDWLQHGLGPMWRPFLIGCAASALVCGFAGWLLLELMWRWSVHQRRWGNRSRAPAAADTPRQID